jgi:hypothetical protein
MEQCSRKKSDKEGEIEQFREQLTQTRNLFNASRKQYPFLDNYREVELMRLPGQLPVTETPGTAINEGQKLASVG